MSFNDTNSVESFKNETMRTESHTKFMLDTNFSAGMRDSSKIKKKLS